MPKRYYCPGCGQVAGHSRIKHIARVRGGRVEAHFMVSRMTAVIPGIPNELTCPGGHIDKERDRAP